MAGDDRNPNDQALDERLRTAYRRQVPTDVRARHLLRITDELAGLLRHEHALGTTAF